MPTILHLTPALSAIYPIIILSTMASPFIYKDSLRNDEELAQLISDLSLAGSPTKSPTNTSNPKYPQPPKGVEVLTGDSDDDNWPDTDTHWTRTSELYSSEESDITTDNEYDNPTFNKHIAMATKAGT